MDSEIIGAEVFSEELARHGISLSARDCHQQFQGKTLRDCMSRLEREFSIALPETFLTTLEEATARRFQIDLRPVDGIRDVLDYLDKQNVPYCVASNGGYEKMQCSLGLTGLLPYFKGRIFSADSVSRGKPDPALFLWAAESMGVPPEFCRVIEDSESGLEAARAAGMTVFHYSDKSGADATAAVFSRMGDLPELLNLRYGT